MLCCCVVSFYLVVLDEVYYQADIVAQIDRAAGHQVDLIEYMGQVVLDLSALGVEDDLALDDLAVEMLRVENHDQNYLNLSFDSLVFLFKIKVMFDLVYEYFILIIRITLSMTSLATTTHCEFSMSRLKNVRVSPKRSGLRELF